MKKVPLFEDFVPVGFGASNAANFGLGGGYKNTGYSMDAIVGPVEQCSNHVAEQANSYESNDNAEHTAEAYIKEAKKHINDKIDEACENYSAMGESVINEGTDIGSWNQGGLKGNENVQVTTFFGPKDIEDFGLGRKCMQINVGRSYVSLNPADIVELKELFKNYKA
tara:strand:- start:1482 stop:1982 length:501 start_codon:yes stop_codon:yes gene_type:complete